MPGEIRIERAGAEIQHVLGMERERVVAAPVLHGDRFDARDLAVVGEIEIAVEVQDVAAAPRQVVPQLAAAIDRADAAVVEQVDQIVAGAPEGVVAGAGHDRVIARAAVERIGGVIVAAVEAHLAAALDQVVAAAASDFVAAEPAVEDVVAAVAVHLVAAGVAIELVGVGRAIVLPLDFVGRERRGLLRYQHIVEGAVGNCDGAAVHGQHHRVVLGDAGRVFLIVRVSLVGRRLHDDARLRAVDAGPPCAFRADDLAVLELLGVFAEVPDVAELILGEVVVGLFHDLAVDDRRIVDDVADDAVDHLGLACDDEIVDLAAVRALRGEGRAGLQVEEEVVDHRHEIVGIDRVGHGSDSFPKVRQGPCGLLVAEGSLAARDSRSPRARRRGY